MPKQNSPLLAFNRGIVSPVSLARVDVERVRLSAEEMTNWMPKTQGAMFLRVGTRYLGSSRADAEANWIPFVASTEDTALIEITDLRMRVWIDDELIERPTVTTTISDGDFAVQGSWVSSASTGGGTATFGGSGLILDAVNRGGNAVVTREITVAGADQGLEHSLNIVVARGPITFRCGSSAGGEQYVEETELRTGRHKLAFTPSGNFHLEFSSDVQVDRIVTSIVIEDAGIMSTITPWAEADLQKLRWDQSADVLFIACEGYKQHRIERRGSGRSWSIVEYDADDGPFTSGRTASHVRLKPGATFGNTTLTADKKFFKQAHVGALFRLFHKGHRGVFNLGRDDTYTDPIRVTGVNGTEISENGWNFDDRNWGVSITGTWNGTLTVQRSFDGPDAGFGDYDEPFYQTTFFSNGSENLSDPDHNSIVHYRVGFKTGHWSSGAAVVSVSYDGGGDYGICRVTGYTSAFEVTIEILRDFNDDEYTEDWREGLWSAQRGYPTEVVLNEGRLCWFGRTYQQHSVSDAFDSFDAEVEGDSGPIVRTLGSGPVDVINFALSLQRLVIGTAGAEISIKSSSFDEPLTPQNTGARNVSTQGSATIRAAKVDTRGVFVQRSGRRVIELVMDGQAYDYRSNDLTLLAPDITGSATIVAIGVQRQPDTRLHFVLSNGTVAILTYEPNEEVVCWSMFETDGDVEQVAVLPGDNEDFVYYHINRTIDGDTKRYLERLVNENVCKGGDLSRQLDCHVVNGALASATMTGLEHLVGEDVAVWADGQCLVDADGDIELFTVDADGEITLPASKTAVVAGLPYTATYKSAKLAYAAGLGTALNQTKRAAQVGVILGVCHHKGLEVGHSFTAENGMDYLPLTKDGAEVAAHTVFTEYDQPMFPLPGNHSTDSRLLLRASAPRPCEVLAAVVSVQTSDKG